VGEFYTISDGKLRLNLHPGQARTWDSTRRFTFMLAGSQGGKTALGPWWLWREITKRGPGDYLAVTASYDLFKLKMLPELRTVLENVLHIGRYWAGERIIEICEGARRGAPFRAKTSSDPMWGRIILRSAESGGGLESATAQAAWLDECGQDSFTLETWEAVQRRLSLTQGPVLGTTTLYNLGWLKSEAYDRWRDGDPDTEIVQFASYVNPAFPRVEYDRMADRMQGWRFAMFYRGEFAKPGGLIYGDFTDAMLVDPRPIPHDWRTVVGVDFGGVNQASVWLSEDPETSIWYVWHETLEGGLTSSEHLAKAQALATGYTDLAAVGGAKSESQQRRDWGYWVQEPPLDDVEAGIDRGVALVKTNRLRVFRTCRGFRDELGTYSRKLDAAGNPTDEILDKRKFHRLDAYRYAATVIESGSVHFG
jgi:hypothetical protein